MLRRPEIGRDGPASLTEQFWRIVASGIYYGSPGLAILSLLT
jgi:hypothetical protein